MDTPLDRMFYKKQREGKLTKFDFPRAYFECGNCKNRWQKIIPYPDREKLDKCQSCGTAGAPYHVHLRFDHLYRVEVVRGVIFLIEVIMFEFDIGSKWTFLVWETWN